MAAAEKPKDLFTVLTEAYNSWLSDPLVEFGGRKVGLSCQESPSVGGFVEFCRVYLERANPVVTFAYSAGGPGVTLTDRVTVPLSAGLVSTMSDYAGAVPVTGLGGGSELPPTVVYQVNGG